MPGPGRSLELSLHDARAALDALLADRHAVDTIQRVPALLAASIRAGGKILAVGNGGSSCDAAHFAEELTGRFRGDRTPIAALACTDVGHVTCTANDYGFAHVFARWVQALARPGDCVILLSTSGASENILRAAQAARDARATSIALLGKGGGALKGRCDIEVIVPGATSDRIQELHMLILHAWCEGLEHELGLVKPG
jgi:D-sedoheptulose 7-phosphate isomerase